MDGSTAADVRKKWCSYFNKVITAIAIKQLIRLCCVGLPCSNQKSIHLPEYVSSIWTENRLANCSRLISFYWVGLTGY